MKENFNKREVMRVIEPVIENTAMRYGLIPLEISLERENNRHFLFHLYIRTKKCYTYDITVNKKRPIQKVPTL